MVLMYTLRKVVCNNDFSEQLQNSQSLYKE